MASINASTSGAGGVITTADATGTLQLQSASTTVATINGFGIGLGTGVPSSGIGITFQATQSASSNANTLDDYEEGTFTPKYLVNGVESTGVTYGAQLGAYTKIGNVVTATVFLALTNKGSSTGSFTAIGNFPFPSIASPAYLQAGTFGYTVNFTTLAPTTGYNDNGTAYFLLFNPSASNWIGSSNITNTTNLSFSVTYLTSS